LHDRRLQRRRAVSRLRRFPSENGEGKTRPTSPSYGEYLHDLGWTTPTRTTGNWLPPKQSSALQSGPNTLQNNHARVATTLLADVTHSNCSGATPWYNASPLSNLNNPVRHQDIFNTLRHSTPSTSLLLQAPTGFHGLGTTGSHQEGPLSRARAQLSSKLKLRVNLASKLSCRLV